MHDVTADIRQPLVAAHPRLYFTAEELIRLRALRGTGVHARIWERLAASADWCLTLPQRAEWIAPVEPDPIYLNLYERFYGMMRDMAAMEHLAFAYAYSGETRYLEGARAWTLACCRVWRYEAEGEADGSKAYAVMRLLKGLAIGYDLLYHDLSEAERAEVRATLIEIGSKYYRWYLENPSFGTIEQGAHHASVETTSFGIAGLALLGEVDEAAEWVALMVRKHAASLLPGALTPSGACVEGLTFYTSIMQYRLMFMDALRRVTGTDLFTPFAAQMSGRLALAKIAAPKVSEVDENHGTVIHEPCYGQLNYWAPVLLYLAREYREPIYQQLALWDELLGAIQRSRFVLPGGSMLIFAFGGYAYAWYDPTVPADAPADAPLSFDFPETNEAYMRAGFQAGDMVVGCRLGAVVVHAGGRPVLIEMGRANPEPEPVPGLTLADDGKTAAIENGGTSDAGFTRQRLVLQRPGRCTVTREMTGRMQWWCHGAPEREGNLLRWPDGTTLRVTRGAITAMEPAGYRDVKIVGLGLLKCDESYALSYPLITAVPEGGELVIEIESSIRE